MIGANDAAWIGCLSVVGWAAWRWYRRCPERPNPAVVAVVWAAVMPGVWMLTLDLAGQGWSSGLMATLACAALLVGVLARRVWKPAHRSAAGWVALGTLVPASVASVIAMRPNVGWDFRYLWGLKAKVFALAGRNDPLWLSWPPNTWHHSDYPPLWPDLLAFGSQHGSPITTVAAIWQVVLLLGLAAACWDILREEPPLVRVAGAAIGTFAPVILGPEYWGNAELLVAFLSAVAFGSLNRLRAGSSPDPAAALTLGAVVVGLCLAKNEGMVLAFGLAVAALLLGNRLAKVVAPIAFMVGVSSWQLFMSIHGLGREPRTVRAGALVVAGHQMAGWIWQHAWSPVGVILLTWVLALLALATRRTAGLVLAAIVWWAGVIVAYLTVADGTAWRLATSFDRVIAAPLPGFASAALAASLKSLRQITATGEQPVQNRPGTGRREILTQTGAR